MHARMHLRTVPVCNRDICHTYTLLAAGCTAPLSSSFLPCVCQTLKLHVCICRTACPGGGRRQRWRPLPPKVFRVIHKPVHLGWHPSASLVPNGSFFVSAWRSKRRWRLMPLWGSCDIPRLS